MFFTLSRRAANTRQLYDYIIQINKSPRRSGRDFKIRTVFLFLHAKLAYGFSGELVSLRFRKRTVWFTRFLSYFGFRFIENWRKAAMNPNEHIILAKATYAYGVPLVHAMTAEEKKAALAAAKKNRNMIAKLLHTDRKAAYSDAEMGYIIEKISPRYFFEDSEIQTWRRDGQLNDELTKQINVFYDAVKKHLDGHYSNYTVRSAVPVREETIKKIRAKAASSKPAPTITPKKAEAPPQKQQAKPAPKAAPEAKAKTDPDELQVAELVLACRTVCYIPGLTPIDDVALMAKWLGFKCQNDPKTLRSIRKSRALVIALHRGKIEKSIAKKARARLAELPDIELKGMLQILLKVNEEMSGKSGNLAIVLPQHKPEMPSAAAQEPVQPAKPALAEMQTVAANEETAMPVVASIAEIQDAIVPAENPPAAGINWFRAAAAAVTTPLRDMLAAFRRSARDYGRTLRRAAFAAAMCAPLAVAAMIPQPHVSPAHGAAAPAATHAVHKAAMPFALDKAEVRLNLRRDPSTAHAPLRILSPNEKVIDMGQTVNGFRAVGVPTGQGLIRGFVRTEDHGKAYLTPG